MEQAMYLSKTLLHISCSAALLLVGCKNNPGRCPSGSQLTLVAEDSHKTESCRDDQDRLQGKQVLTFDNGTIGKKAHYVDGKRHGLLTIWLKTGQMKSRRLYVSGKKHGLEETWSKTGQKLSETNYDADQKHGEEMLWYPNGKKASHGTYVKGRPDGEWAQWHENGALRSKNTYEKGRLSAAPLRGERAPRSKATSTTALSKKVLAMGAKQINEIGQAIQARLQKSSLKSEIASFEMGSAATGLYARLSFLVRSETRTLLERQVLSVSLAYEISQATPFVTSVEVVEVKDREPESKKSPIWQGRIDYSGLQKLKMIDATKLVQHVSLVQ